MEDKVGHGQGDHNHNHPVSSANFLSFATFSWMSPLMFRKGDRETVPLPPEEETSSPNTCKLEELYGDRRNIGTCLWKMIRGRVYVTSVIYLSSIVLGFIGPTFLMKRVLEFTSSPDAKNSSGLIWIGLLLLCELLRVLLFTLTWARSYRSGLRLKAAVMGLVYKKIFSLRLLDSGTGAEGSKILNVISLDAARIYEGVTLGQVAIGGPLVLLLSICYMLWELGWMSLVGMVVFPLAYPLQYAIARWSGKLRAKGAEVRDKRVAVVAELVNNFKSIKMMGWEKYFSKSLQELRDLELKYLRGSGLLQSFSVVLGPTLPHVGAILTFILYLNAGHKLSPPQGFIIIALLVGRIRPTISRARSGFRAWFDAQIALGRIKCFTLLFVFSLVGYSVRAFSQLGELWYNCRIARDRIKSVLELPNVAETRKSLDISSEFAIVLEDVSIGRREIGEADSVISGSNEGGSVQKLLDGDSSEESNSSSLSFLLHNLNIKIRAGSFIGLVGQVGSGKSTLLSSISGSLPALKGFISVRSFSLSYAPQVPWIFKGSLRSNIVFGEAWDSLIYYKTIDACALTPDFASLPQGDLTPTDHSGSNLSGGQRLRVALARTIYSALVAPSRDLVLLDDPFSGLDERVGQSILERALKGILLSAGKTIILATHQLQLLQSADEILLLSQGTIKAQGTADQLQSSCPEYRQLLQTSGTAHSQDQTEQELTITKIPEKAGSSNEEGPNVDTLTSKGRIPRKVYSLYISAAGGLVAFFCVILGFALSIGSTAFSSWWLKRWFDNNSTVEISEDLPSYSFYRDVYASLIGVIFLFSLFRALLFVLSTTRASRGLHFKMARVLLSARAKSVGRLGEGQLLNLFSKDVGELDYTLPQTMELFLQNIFIIATIFFLVSLMFPLFLVPLGILGCIFVWVRNIFNSAVRDLKRLETRAKTPIFSQVAETLQGLSTLRAYQKQSMALSSFFSLVDNYHGAFYAYCGSIRWLAIRLDLLAVCVTGSVAVLILLFHGSVSAAAAGLALAYAAQLSGVFQFTVRLASETEAKFVSVERIRNFLISTPTEELDLNFNLRKDSTLLPVWPYYGKVKFDAVSLFYGNSKGLDDVSFEVQGGQRVGIVGRTGSGKSSIGSALFRLYDIKSGSIFVDDVDISSVSLEDLRVPHALGVVPQSPTIFRSSLRFNLDPGSLHCDGEIWGALKKVGLGCAFSSLELQPDVVGLSEGQRQLLAFARVLLTSPKVLFVDEGTASVDAEAGKVIDDLLANEFPSTTIFIVAHRPSALAHCDVILVMEGGRVKDFGSAGDKYLNF